MFTLPCPLFICLWVLLCIAFNVRSTYIPFLASYLTPIQQVVLFQLVDRPCTQLSALMHLWTLGNHLEDVVVVNPQFVPSSTGLPGEALVQDITYPFSLSLQFRKISRITILFVIAL